VFSFLRTLTTWHCPHSLLSAGRAAVDRYILPVEPTAAPAAAGLLLWARAGTPYRYIDSAPHSGSASNASKDLAVYLLKLKLTACSAPVTVITPPEGTLLLSKAKTR